MRPPPPRPFQVAGDVAQILQTSQPLPDRRGGYAHGIANLLVLHRLSDLDAVGAAGSEVRALAEGLLADCATRVIYRQETDQLASAGSALGLTRTERDLLPALPRGTGLWKVANRSYVVHHRLHPDEATVFDTDAAMRGQGGVSL